MFDLRSNFVVKINGKEDFIKGPIDKADRTMFLCVGKDVMDKLFALFPKSKLVV